MPSIPLRSIHFRSFPEALTMKGISLFPIKPMKSNMQKPDINFHGLTFHKDLPQKLCLDECSLMSSKH